MLGAGRAAACTGRQGCLARLHAAAAGSTWLHDSRRCRCRCCCCCCRPPPGAGLPRRRHLVLTLPSRPHRQRSKRCRPTWASTAERGSSSRYTSKQGWRSKGWTSRGNGPKGGWEHAAPAAWRKCAVKPEELPGQLPGAPRLGAAPSMPQQCTPGRLPVHRLVLHTRTCVRVAGARQRHAVPLPAAQVDPLLSNLSIVAWGGEAGERRGRRSAACRLHCAGRSLEPTAKGLQICGTFSVHTLLPMAPRPCRPRPAQAACTCR